MSNTFLVLQPTSFRDVPPPPPAPTNEALMARIQQNDGEALWTLFNRHAPLVESVIRRFVQDEAQCDELVREVFEDIRDRAEYYTPDKGRALGWILTVARRRAIDHARRLQLATRPEVQPETRTAPTRATGQRRIQKGKLNFGNLFPGFGEAAA